MDIELRLQRAVEQFWAERANQRQKQIDSGKPDVGTRGSVTGGTHMSAFEVLLTDILVNAGLKELPRREAVPGKCWQQGRSAVVVADADPCGPG